jgi:hypothetical protein
MVFLTYLQAKRAEQVLFVASFVDHQIKSNHANAIQMGKIMIIPFFLGALLSSTFMVFRSHIKLSNVGFQKWGYTKNGWFIVENPKVKWII